MTPVAAETVVHRQNGVRCVVRTDRHGRHWVDLHDGARLPLRTKGPHEAAVNAFINIGDRIEAVPRPSPTDPASAAATAPRTHSRQRPAPGGQSP
jgi:hypothetical protein